MGKKNFTIQSLIKKIIFVTNYDRNGYLEKDLCFDVNSDLNFKFRFTKVLEIVKFSFPNLY